MFSKLIIHEIFTEDGRAKRKEIRANMRILLITLLFVIQCYGKHYRLVCLEPVAIRGTTTNGKP